MRPQAEVAGVLRALGDGIEQIGLNTHQLRHLSAIKKCRTAELGGHVDACDACGTIHVSYNSCRNRHCPKCQGHNREEWMQARIGELLPVPYFHVVFTLPDRLNALAMQHPKTVYGCLFSSVWETLQTFFANQEFSRRFALHILPHGFVRIRHYGILGGTWKKERLHKLQKQLGVKLQSPNPEKETWLRRCPHCKSGTLVTIVTFWGRAPPEDLLRGLLSRSC